MAGILDDGKFYWDNRPSSVSKLGSKGDTNKPLPATGFNKLIHYTFCQTIVLIQKMIIPTWQEFQAISDLGIVFKRQPKDRSWAWSGSNNFFYFDFLCRHCPWNLLFPRYEKEDHRHCTSRIFCVSSQGGSISLQVMKQTLKLFKGELRPILTVTWNSARFVYTNFSRGCYGFCLETERN